MKAAALFQVVVASGWTCAYAIVVWVVPAAFRNMVPFPYNLHALHLLMDTLDHLGWAVACALLVAAVFTFSRRYDESRAAWLHRVGKAPGQWWLGAFGAVVIGLAATAQRYLVYSQLDEALMTGRITYPMTAPVENFDAVLVRWQWVDLAMVAGGMIVAFAGGRRLLAEPALESARDLR